MRCFFKKKTIWITWNQSRKTKQNCLQGLWAVKERPSNSVCVHEAENLSQSSLFFFQWKHKARDGINFWAQKERRWDNYKLTQQNICCLSSDAPALRFEWVENLCVSVFCGCQGGLRWNLFLLWWSCALYVTTDTVNRVLLLAWWENRYQ